MMISANLIRKISEVEPHLREILILILEEIEKHTQQIAQQVTKQEFNELKEIVAELAEAQKKTEQRLNELAEAQRETEQRVAELAKAQQKSEERLTKLEQTVAELAEAQKKTEQRLNELAEAQKKTEQRLNELAEAQKQTEQRLNELAEAQKKTEEELRKLAQSLNRTNKQLGGLSRSVAYALENESYRYLPHLLKSKYDIEITERFIRTYISNEEINIFAKAKKNGEEFYIVGESVLKLDDRSKLRQVMHKVNIVKEELGGNVIPIIVTHFAKPDVLKRAHKAGIIVVQRFEW